MRGRNLALFTGLLALLAPAANAKSTLGLPDSAGGAPTAAAPGVLQCVPFARNLSGIDIHGDAHTWWSQAAGKYARGRAPRPGAVMAIQPHGGSSLGHVAMVSRVVDARTILISHANWSGPGKIERNVTATDVSPANDWSQVRVWYAPIQNLGSGHWPVAGFIYNAKPGASRKLLANESDAPRLTKASARSAAFNTASLATGNATASKSGRSRPASTLTRFVASKTVQVRFGQEPLYAAKAPPRFTPARKGSVKLAVSSGRRDPIGAILAANR